MKSAHFEDVSEMSLSSDADVASSNFIEAQIYEEDGLRNQKVSFAFRYKIVLINLFVVLLIIYINYYLVNEKVLKKRRECNSFVECKIKVELVTI